MFNIVILGCKKTLVEYRGWVNRNCYYLRNPIRMGGLFSRNDFVQRLTRPEYFPIATSPQKPTIPPFLKLPIHKPSPSPNTSPPQIPSKIPSPNPTPSQNSPISPNLTHTPSTIPPFIYTFSKNPLNSP